MGETPVQLRSEHRSRLDRARDRQTSWKQRPSSLPHEVPAWAWPFFGLKKPDSNEVWDPQSFVYIKLYIYTYILI